MTRSLLHRGKVRDVYDAGDGSVLLVASDRVSAFDVVMAEPIPDKGRVLTAMSAFWFERTADLAPSHLLSTEAPPDAPELAGRVMVCRRLRMLPVECVVRGYLAGSAWKEYEAAGTVHGARLPPGLRPAEQLSQPLFTPSTKAAAGGHDENISFDQAVALVGGERAEAAREVSLAVYRRGAAWAAERGVIVADTKLEVGLDEEGRLVIGDELLTPDSSRFWPADAWRPGSVPPSLDKQPLRDELERRGWDKRPPPPPLSPQTVAATRQRYVAAYERLTGRRLRDWPGGPPVGGSPS